MPRLEAEGDVVRWDRGELQLLLDDRLYVIGNVNLGMMQTHVVLDPQQDVASSDWTPSLAIRMPCSTVRTHLECIRQAAPGAVLRERQSYLSTHV